MIHNKNKVLQMKKMIEQFTMRVIVKEMEEADLTVYYDAADESVAEVYVHEDGSKNVTLYQALQDDEVVAATEQITAVLEQVKTAFCQPHLVTECLTQNDGTYYAELRRKEPTYGVVVRGTGLDVTINEAGQLEEVYVHTEDTEIMYPEAMISPAEAKCILQEQQLLKLTISAEHGWRYMYGQKFDLDGIAPDGTVRFWHDDVSVQGIGFEELPNVEVVDELEAYIRGGRQVELEQYEDEERLYWYVDCEEQRMLEEAHYIRACRILKTLVGEAYANYKLEVYGNLYEELGIPIATEEASYRFVYIVDDISFDFHAVTVNMCTTTNQVESVSKYHIPYEQLKHLEKPKLTLEEANQIARQYVDVELALETDLKQRHRQSFVYLMNYPSSPTQGHIQFVDAENGDIYWVETG